MSADREVALGHDDGERREAYKIEEIAALLQCSVRHVFRQSKQNKIPGKIHCCGRLSRFSRAAVDAWLAGEPPNPPSNQKDNGAGSLEDASVINAEKSS
jgi:excisionase family DNA binding protein